MKSPLIPLLLTIVTCFSGSAFIVPETVNTLAFDAEAFVDGHRAIKLHGSDIRDAWNQGRCNQIEMRLRECFRSLFIDKPPPSSREPIPAHRAGS